MTKHELNRDIKRLSKKVGTDKEYTPEFETEFKRLYHADTSMQSLNADSMRIMVRLNLRHRFIALHSFGLMININNV